MYIYLCAHKGSLGGRPPITFALELLKFLCNLLSISQLLEQFSENSSGQMTVPKPKRPVHVCI